MFDTTQACYLALKKFYIFSEDITGGIATRKNMIRHCAATVIMIKRFIPWEQNRVLIPNNMERVR